MKTLIKVNNLSKTYGHGNGEVFALNGLNLNICQGELLVILGSSGSGKSTLLNLLGGMDSPSGGEILFNGRNISSFSTRERISYRKDNVGFVFQAYKSD
ncbi:MAG: ATP-binding cassette domain-containing protein [Bacilli bacterium]